MNIQKRIAATVLLTFGLTGHSFAEEVKVKIEGSLPDAVKLIERLNANGKDSRLTYVLAEDD